MSRSLISLNPDLKRLQDEGYSVEVTAGYLLVPDIPYVNANREIRMGTLVSSLTLAGQRTKKPDNHVVLFAGETPCDEAGRELHKVIHGKRVQELGGGIQVTHRFSHKPPEGYRNYYEKMSTYANIISEPAQRIDPHVTPRPFRVIGAAPEDSVFEYDDTASSRAEIGHVTDKLAIGAVAVIGLGGTGSYILDLVAKTPVREIHLFDGDGLYQHNAFRAPGAPSVDDLEATPNKAEHYAGIYSKMHRNIHPHGYVEEVTQDELQGMDFAFIAVDRGTDRRVVVEKLLEFGIPFVDAGMSVYEVEGSLIGTLRVTRGTPGEREHIPSTIPCSDAVGQDEYSTNIQVADLNMLNAAMAVIEWKKYPGFYQRCQDHHSCYYVVDGNQMTNDNQA